MSDPERPMRWYMKLLIPVISVGLFLGISELVCWALKLAPPKPPPFKFVVRDRDNDVEYPFMVEDPNLLWGPKAGFDGREDYHGENVQINLAGFRDRDYSTTKPPDVFRILRAYDEEIIHAYLAAEEAATREQNIPFVIVPSLNSTPNPDLFVDANHPNCEGHVVLALALLKQLQNLGYLPESDRPPDATQDRVQQTDPIGKFLQGKASAAPNGSLRIDLIRASLEDKGDHLP